MKIALINFGGIGDEILFLPTIKSLKKMYPQSIISLILEPRSKCIEQLTNLIDKTIECDIKSSNRFIEVFKLLITLWRGKYDMIVSSGSSPLISIILFLSGIKKRYGYDTGRLSRFLLTKAIKLNKQQYAAEMYHDLISPLGDEKAQLPKIIIKNSFQTNPMQDKLNIPTGKKIILIHPGSSKLSRQKNIIKSYAKWDEVIQKLKENYTVLLVGGPDDKDVIEKINTDGIINLYGVTKDIKDLAKLIKKADLTLCIDSAPMHMAVALDKTLIAIFGPTDEKKLLPNDEGFGEKFIALTTHSSCRPCLWDKRAESCDNPTCLDITSGKIVTKVDEILQTHLSHL